MYVHLSRSLNKYQRFINNPFGHNMVKYCKYKSEVNHAFTKQIKPPIFLLAIITAWAWIYHSAKLLIKYLV